MSPVGSLIILPTDVDRESWSDLKRWVLFLGITFLLAAAIIGTYVAAGSTDAAAGDPEDPGDFNSLPATDDPNPDIPMCSGQPRPRGLTVLRAGKTENFIDETDEIGLAVLWRNSTPYPTNKTLVRYQVKFNLSHYSWVRVEKFYGPIVPNSNPPVLYLDFAIKRSVGQPSPVGAVQLPIAGPPGPNKTAGSIGRRFP